MARRLLSSLVTTLTTTTAIAIASAESPRTCDPDGTIIGDNIGGNAGSLTGTGYASQRFPDFPDFDIVALDDVTVSGASVIVTCVDMSAFGPNGFGDWDWYAQNRDRWYNVFDTVLVPTQGTLGRRNLGQRTKADILAIYDHIPITALAVEAKLVGELRSSLWSEYRSQLSTEHYNPRYRMHFVHSQRRFWFYHNCNDSLAIWLRKLDCTVPRSFVATDAMAAKTFSVIGSYYPEAVFIEAPSLEGEIESAQLRIHVPDFIVVLIHGGQ